MKERSRPPGLDQIAGDGVRLGGWLALGLFAIPLLGLALLTKGSRGTANAESGPSLTPGADEQPAGPDPTAEPNGPTEPGGPERAEIEQALRNLAHATMPKRSRVNGAAAPKGPRADALKAAAPAKADKRSRRTRTKTPSAPPSLPAS